MGRGRIKYLPPVIDSTRVMEEWPYFKLMILNNCDYQKDKTKIFG